MPKRNNVAQVGTTSDFFSTPAMPYSNAKDVAITLTLAEVCNELSPFVANQKLLKRKRRRHRSHSHGDKYCILSSMSHSSQSRDSIGAGDKQSKKM